MVSSLSRMVLRRVAAGFDPDLAPGTATGNGRRGADTGRGSGTTGREAGNGIAADTTTWNVTAKGSGKGRENRATPGNIAAADTNLVQICNNRIVLL